MLINTKTCLAIFILTLLIGNLFQLSLAQDANIVYDWQLKKNKKGIQIYTSKIENSKYKAVRAQAEINTNIESAIALLLDLTACSEWAHLCVESRHIETVSNTESYVYTYNDVPFPAKNRDIVSHVVWQFDQHTGKVSMLSNAVEGRVQQSKKAVRITKAVAQWHFTPISNTMTLVECYVHLDPAGPVPAWLINLLLISSPYKTIRNMRSILESGRYQSPVLPFSIPLIDDNKPIN